jgi:hypothetical protein
VRRLFAAALLVALVGCSSEKGRIYSDNDLQLLTQYSAKEICSCVFVMGRDEGFCAAWAKQQPDLKTFRVDRARGTVETEAVLFWGARARYLGPRRGCLLE